jgi:hypothetical protein
MLNSHNTRGAAGRGGRGMVTGRGIPGHGVSIPNFPIPLNQLATPGIIAFNPAFLATAEQDAEDLLYADTTIAELAIIPGDALELMRVKARQLKRKREAASAEELERARLLMYAAESMKELGQVEATTFSKYVFTDLDGKDLFIKNYSKGVEILASSNQLRRMGNAERNVVWIGDNSVVLSESRIVGDIDYRVKTDNFNEPFKSLEMWNSLKNIRILHKDNFKYLLSLICDHVAPEGFNLAIFLPIGEELNNFSALLTAFSGLDDVFTAFYDPIWTGCADSIKHKLKTSTVRNVNFMLVRDLLECQFRQFCSQIITRNTVGTDKLLDCPANCRLLFVELMVLDENNLDERRERMFLSQRLSPYLHPLNDERKTSQASGKNSGSINTYMAKTVTPTSQVLTKTTGTKVRRSVSFMPNNTNNICLFHMLDFFKINSSAGNPLGPCNKRNSCKLDHPLSGPVGRGTKDLWVKSVTDSGLFYARNQAISKQVISAINACP